MNDTTNSTACPEGYMRNAMGHLVPLAQVREQDKLRDQVARDLVEEALDLNERLRQFKARARRDIADLVRISADRYDVTMGGEKGNVTVTTYDGQYKVIRAYADLLTFTEELEVAKELVARCMDRWSQGADENYRALVDRAFRTDRKGKVRTAALLDLLRLDIKDEEWKKAMAALADSIQTSGTAEYIRVYRRVQGSDRYVPVALDLAAL